MKRHYPKHAVIVSLMVETEEEWRDIILRSIDAGADGLELNFGCPHGMCERGMGSAVGQEPKANERITSWVMKYSTIPVLVKLTPNVDDIVPNGLAAKAGGANGVSLINTIKSIIGVDLDRMTIEPRVGAQSSNGGYCGAAVKPIALHMVAALAREPDFGLPISGIGGISNWRDAAEFLALGSSSVQVCTEVMLRGYRIVEDMIEGLSIFMSDRGMTKLDDLIGKAVPTYSEWGDLDMNYETVAKIDASKCIGCHLCVVACDDGAHQCIHAEAGTHARATRRRVRVRRLQPVPDRVPGARLHHDGSGRQRLCADNLERAHRRSRQAAPQERRTLLGHGPDPTDARDHRLRLQQDAGRRRHRERARLRLLGQHDVALRGDRRAAPHRLQVRAVRKDRRLVERPEDDPRLHALTVRCDAAARDAQPAVRAAASALRFFQKR